MFGSARIVTVVTVTALCLSLAPSALAGKGSRKPPSGTSSISLVLVNSTDGLAHYGQTVRFNVSSTQTDQPWVNLLCSQNGKQVLERWNGYFEGSLTGRDFGLYSGQWTGGAADCTAWLTTPQWTRLASTSFHVYA